MVSTFVEFNSEIDRVIVEGAEVTQKGRLATVALPLSELAELAGSEGIAYVSTGEVLEAPNPRTDAIGVPEPDFSNVLADPELQGGEPTVLIGIIDVGGFDFSHPALDDTRHLFDGIEEFRQHLGGRLTLTMLRNIGDPIEVHEVDLDAMRAAISEVGAFEEAPDEDRTLMLD